MAKFKVTHPFDYNRICLLSQTEQIEYLKLLSTLANNRKIPSTSFENNNLQYLLNVGLVEREIESENYWEEGNHFLSVEDYNKLLCKYNKELIDNNIKSFTKWINPNKNKRNNIYLTINNWCSKSTKFIMTEEQNTFILKSFNSYVVSTGVTGSSKVAYFTVLEKLFKQGEIINDLREYIKLSIIKQLENSNSDYRKKAENIFIDYGSWKKINKKGEIDG